MTTVIYRPIAGQGVGYGLVNGGLVALIGVGLFAAHYVNANGHHVTGMSNQIVWGLPHVFAVFLIVAASGALNVASLASVFGRTLMRHCPVSLVCSRSRYCVVDWPFWSSISDAPSV